MPELATQVGYIAAFPAYALLFLLVATRSTKILRPYVRVLLFNSFVDLFFVFFGFFCNAEHTFTMTDKGLIYFVLINGVVRYPPKALTLILMGMNQFAVFWSISVIPVNFGYRYFLICRNRQIGWRGFSGLAVLSLVGPSIVLGTWLNLFWPKEDDNYFQKYFNETDGGTPVYVMSRQFGDSSAIIFISVIGLIPSYIYYVFVTVATILIMLKLRQMQNSKRAKAMQREMTLILTVQALVPFLSFVIPLSLIYGGMIFGFEVPQMWVFALVSVYGPLFNAIFTIVVMGPYRKAMVDVFCNIVKPVNRSESSTGPIVVSSGPAKVQIS